ncbi:unnamed protein product, partial [Symbiodinium natans]
DDIRDATVIVAGEAPRRLHDCRSISGEDDASVAAPMRRFVLSFNCPLEVGQTNWIRLEVYDAGAGGATVGQLQMATAPLSGSFLVGHSGTWSAAIEARTATRSWTHICSRITAMRRPAADPAGQLELECWKHPWGWSTSESLQVLVRFRRPIGNVPELELNTSGLPRDVRGLQGTGFQVQVFTLEDGDADAIFFENVRAHSSCRDVPLEMFQVPRPPDVAVKPVRVVSEGILGAYGGSSPIGYTYSSGLVPILHSAMPASVTADDNLTLVISNIQSYNSTGWIEDLQVVLGEDAGHCKDLHEVSEDQGNITIICRLDNARAGVPGPLVRLYRSRDTGVATITV